jgi:uncharacterized protein (DUF4415 family)
MAHPPRRTQSAAEKAEAMFKAATTKKVEIPAALERSAIPVGKETVSLKIERDVLAYFQDGGPGWRDRLNAALRNAATLSTSASTPPAKLVVQFLSAMEERDLATARSYLAADFSMIFPGGVVFTKLEQLIEWAKPRYQSIQKTYEKFDEAFDKDGAVVYCFGSLSGQWLDGSSFEGIRFVDRFRIVDEKLTSQRVWNDMAEARR